MMRKVWMRRRRQQRGGSYERDPETGEGGVALANIKYQSTTFRLTNGIKDKEISVRNGHARNIEAMGSTARSNSTETKTEPSVADAATTDPSPSAHSRWTAFIVAFLIVLLGLGSSSAFLAIGLSAAWQDTQLALDKDLAELAWGVEAAFREYEKAGLWVHQACTSQKQTSSYNYTAGTTLSSSNLISRAFFREVYESLVANSLPFHGVQFIPNVTHAERESLEEEARNYYQEHYPELPPYEGFSGFVPDNTTQLGLRLEARSPQDFYFPVHYVEPVLDNVGVIDFDVYSEPYPRLSVDTALSTWQPVVTGRLRLIQEFDPSPDAYSVLLMHPGITVSTDPLRKPRDVSLLAIRIPALFQYIVDQQVHDIPTLQLYLYDSTPDDPDIDQQEPLFLGGVHIHGDQTWKDHPEAQAPAQVPSFDVPSTGDGPPGNHPQYSPYYWKNPHHQEPSTYLEYLSCKPLSELHESQRNASAGSDKAIDFVLTKNVTFNARRWTIVAVAGPNTPAYTPRTSMAILGGCLIFVVALSLAFLVYCTMRRTSQLHAVKVASDQTQAAMKYEHARQAAAAERELNEFIAHEVRNPLSAALSACSFVQSAIDTCLVVPLRNTSPVAHDIGNTTDGEDTKESILQDLHIMDFSLQFINELLRNMLDFQRASYHQLKVEKNPTDLLQDILRPVDAMLYRRGTSNVTVELECPPNVVVNTDKLRLKQIVLNLGRNSAKFVDAGFIRFKVQIVCGKVQLWVEDSGPGIPTHKRQEVFAKFQESLDSLSQGTGLGLSLCKILAQLLGGDLWLDESYNSGVEGRSGCRFVIDINEKPMEYGTHDQDHHEEQGGSESSSQLGTIAISDRILATAHEEVQRQNTPSTPSPPITTTNDSSPLPERLTVLLVDDDTVLRKLMVRSIRQIAPQWDIQEAASGEAALRLVEEQSHSAMFDLIFMDQYMASTEKQLLGTETTRALRAKGVTSKICGLSANDMAADFYQAGADAFICKPLPVGKNEMRETLCNILDIRN